MKSWQLTGSGYALVFIGAFLPWAEIDLKKAAAGSEGLEALAAVFASTFQRIVQVTAWNGAVNVGTAKLPVWLVLVASTLAASIWMMRARGVRAIPHAASPLLAAAAVALLALFALQDMKGAELLTGFWLSLAGAIVVLVSVLRDATSPGTPAG